MAAITKVLIANRGEIAVRIARACRDAAIGSVAVYADPDRDSLHVKVADEAYALGGATPGESYLVQSKLLDIAKQAGADAVHPGYGFLAENAGFAQAVIDAGLTWIGPSPANAPLVPGTNDPVSGPDEVVDFAKANGLPVAIKAAYGGGGRGLKVARTIEEIPELYESAVREAVTAFGRGECFVERFLDKPRHVETQCLADSHGNVVVVSTRDCSLQRRNQKLVEEAPAPFVTAAQNAELVRASKAILKEANYLGAGTCEYLIGQDGVISFLEVNTRLQVEHCVSEEVTGIDLVREQLRIAAGEPLGYDDPVPHAHSIEFRINGEDAGRGFLPSPGTVTVFEPPSGPGVRLDSGVVAGDVIGGAFDSMLAKLIVTGKDRVEALARSRRALAEFVVDGMPTVIPFHRAVVSDPAYAPADPAAPFTIHTRWIETGFDNTIPPYGGGAAPEAEEQGERTKVVVEVGGKRIEVVLPGGLALGAPSGGGGGAGSAARKKAPRRSMSSRAGAAVSGDTLTAPMQGTIVKIAVSEGQAVEAGDLIVVLEAMKMEQPINAHKAGVVTGIKAAVGETVVSGAGLVEIKDADGE